MARRHRTRRHGKRRQRRRTHRRIQRGGAVADLTSWISAVKDAARLRGEEDKYDYTFSKLKDDDLTLPPQTKATTGMTEKEDKFSIQDAPSVQNKDVRAIANTLRAFLEQEGTPVTSMTPLSFGEMMTRYSAVPGESIEKSAVKLMSEVETGLRGDPNKPVSVVPTTLEAPYKETGPLYMWYLMVNTTVADQEDAEAPLLLQEKPGQAPPPEEESKPAPQEPAAPAE